MLVAGKNNDMRLFHQTLLQTISEQFLDSFPSCGLGNLQLMIIICCSCFSF